MSGPHRLDPHQAAKVTPATLQRYRDAGVRFSDWLRAEGLCPRTSEEWDDLLVEFKQTYLTKMTEFETLVGSVEFFFPNYRGRLPCAVENHSERQDLTGWRKA